MPAGQPISDQVAGNGTGSLTFEVPAYYTLDVESVLAEIDASAAGDTTATLVIADQSGAVIARKRQGEVVDGGTVGSATWALRLDDERATSAGGGAHEYETFRDTVGVLVNANALTVLPWVKDFGDTVLNIFAPNLPSAVKGGAFVFAMMVLPLTGGVGNYTARVQFRLAINGTFNFWNASAPITNLSAPSGAVAFGATRDLNAGNTLDVRVVHNGTGAVRFGLYGGVTRWD